jgi:hypothetical protein
VELITYRGEPAAVVGNGELAVFVPELEARGWDDPAFRFVAAMCRLAMEIERGLVAGRYDDERAEGYARDALMQADCFAALAGVPDVYLAACFGVPEEQVPARRAELGLAALDRGGDCRPA